MALQLVAFVMSHLHAQLLSSKICPAGQETAVLLQPHLQRSLSRVWGALHDLMLHSQAHDASLKRCPSGHFVGVVLAHLHLQAFLSQVCGAVHSSLSVALQPQAHLSRREISKISSPN
jgi:hypothetical protein